MKCITTPMVSSTWKSALKRKWSQCLLRFWHVLLTLRGKFKKKIIIFIHKHASALIISYFSLKLHMNFEIFSQCRQQLLYKNCLKIAWLEVCICFSVSNCGGRVFINQDGWSFKETLDGVNKQESLKLFSESRRDLNHSIKKHGFCFEQTVYL